jgi:flagellum-specific peptidoglycan hydrolase FlgJ
MKKFIHRIILALIFLIVPFYVSNTSDSSALTEEERAIQEMMLRETIILHQIKNKEEEFLIHLDEINAPCFVQDFFNGIKDEAIDSKSLPSVAIAQASIETGYGRYNKLQNNIFGIKGRGIRVYTHEVYKGKWYKVRANFQYFPTLTDAFNKHSEILARYGAKGYNYEYWIKKIKSGGYATDPRYGHKVRFVIEKYRLDLLDDIKKLKSQLPVNKKQEVCNPEFNFFV